MTMKAAVLHEYGSASKLRYEDFDTPKPGPGEVLVRVLAAGVNPVDWKMRSGEAKERFPVQFPAILGRDIAGIVEALGDGVMGFIEGDKVFGLGWAAYAEHAVIQAADLAHIPDGLEMTAAGSLPLVALTADQLIREAAAIQPGQTVFLTGALGSVGRCALFCCAEIGARVIAGVRRKQIEKALALGAVAAIDLADSDELARVGFVDAVADTIGGKLGTQLLAKVKPGGRFGSLLGPPRDAALHPLVDVHAMTARPVGATVAHYGEALRDGRLTLPIDRVLPLSEAADAHTAGERGGAGKMVLTP